MKKIIIITGQTATGKTKLALKLTNKHNGELVNFDSRQVYKDLDIITGKDIGGVLLYNLVNPKEYFSSFDYVQVALKTIKTILKQGKTPILVGGTYLYLKHLLYGFDVVAPPNPKLRLELNKKTVVDLQNILKTLNPKTFLKMNSSDQQNPHRLIRKIEIIKCRDEACLVSTKSLTTLTSLNTPIKIIGLKYKNKTDLIKAIKIRVEKRLEQGAIDEVKNLLTKGYNQDDPGLKTIGYQQIIRFLTGKLTKEEAIKQWTTKEIQYAKRQYTFMKKDKNIQWREI